MMQELLFEKLRIAYFMQQKHKCIFMYRRAQVHSLPDKNTLPLLIHCMIRAVAA